MTLLWLKHAWLPASQRERQAVGDGSWCDDVLLTIDDAGCWSAIDTAVPRDVARSRHASLIDGIAIAPLVNAHSHAFQRAFAGFAERRDTSEDSFWGWRDRMYRIALAIEPRQLKAIAKFLYLEMLRGGYTHVCEFHYLHHTQAGSPYGDDPYAMSIALIEAAGEVGMGLTLLPTVYERAGFDATSLREDQRRFKADADWVLTAQRELSGYRDMYGQHQLMIGAALHSLRAASVESVSKILGSASGPIHIHIAEQRAEVEACLAATGCRPIEYFAKQLRSLDRREKDVWLIHGTHSTVDEINILPILNCGLTICPTTEANLGDGLTDVSAWLGAGVPITIGSDSHVCRDWREELRWLEYGQRLSRERRNVLAAPEHQLSATATRLYGAALSGGASAAGLSDWGMRIGARADLLVIDDSDSALAGVPIDRTLDALVFAGASRPYVDVMVGGQWQISGGVHVDEADIMDGCVSTMRELYS